MLSQTLSFLIFMPFVFLIFYFTKDKYKWIPLLLFSYAVCLVLAKPAGLILLFFVTLLNYFWGIFIHITQKSSNKKAILWIGIVLNLLILLFFKHIFSILNLFSIPVQNNETVLFLSPNQSVEFIGISFYIIQSISYLVDIKNDLIKPEKHFGYFAVYTGLFLKIIQGPIERAKKFIPQMRLNYKFNYTSAKAGLFLILLGMLKKVVIADGLSGYVNQIFGQPYDFSGYFSIIAVYFYALQMYFDFSGYTDIAMGIGKIFNLELTDNFRNPYFANSIAEFWRRWHISFSSWLMDYIFTPLQMKFRKLKKAGIYIALFFTFLFCGMWHGFIWTFIAWGILQALYMIIGDITLGIRQSIHKLFGLTNTKFLKSLQIFITFNLVCLSFVIFTFNSLPDAFHVISKLFSSASYIVDGVDRTNTITFNSLGFNIYAKFSLIIGVAILFLENYVGKNNILLKINKFPLVARWSLYYAIVILILFFGSRFAYQSFIYLQF